jgi:single-stranded-DNA-specific exonuclease
MDEARAIAAKLDEFNLERREIEAAIQTQAIDFVESNGGGGDVGERPLLFLSDPRWHQGVIGIVASRLKDRFRRPTIVIAIDGDVGKGSGRSVPGVDLGAAITAANQAGLLLAGGGHAMAAGLTVAVDKLPALEAFLMARIGQAMAGQPQQADISLDGALTVSGATRDLFDTLEGAGPYGAGHPEPRFAIANADVVKADLVGQNHVRMVLAGPKNGPGGGRLKAIVLWVRPCYRSVAAACIWPAICGRMTGKGAVACNCLSKMQPCRKIINDRSRKIRDHACFSRLS